MNLNEEQMGAITRAIAERKRVIMSGLQEHVARSRSDEIQDIAGEVGDLADKALAELIREGENAAVGRDVRALREVDAAHAHIASNDYGICIGCGEDIAYARLLAQPTATRCITCQNLYERASNAKPSL